ncbi:rhodanese-like domain-containing protein [Halobacteriales archaeon QS_8_65_32]|jgi:rhodanese-related sulfurtransferase|nr:MAG: rhodanese-like domain-containing protein [Halobacteriales archaeon QS_8_65_32]
MVDEESTESLHERLEAGEEVQVVDIRSEREYEEGHVPGAVNVPMSRFASEIERHEWGEDVVVACPIGESSVQAARLLGSYEGVPDDARVASLEGGYRAWEYDLETGSGDNSESDAGAEPDVDAPF